MCGRSSGGRWKVVCKAVADLCTMCRMCVCVGKEGREEVTVYKCVGTFAQM